MIRFNVEENFGHELEALYEIRLKDKKNANRGDEDIINRGLAIEKTIGKNSILFIGMNPSFDEKKDKENGSYGVVSYYDDFGHSYFSPMVKIAAACGVSIAHHDLYFVKETSQNVVIDLSAKYPEYFKRQIEITNDIIKNVHPLAIVIADAAVADLFIDKKTGRQSNCAHFDNNLGTYIINTPGLDSVPVFCSSMLSGTRALDKYSRERLVWQIQRALGLPPKDTMLTQNVDWNTLLF